MEKPDYSSSQVSEFNQNAAIIQRLHNQWLDCRKYRERGNLMRYKDILESIQLELYVDSTPDDKEKLEGLDKQLMLAMFKRVFGKVYSILTKKEMLLRSIENNAGKGSTYKSLDDDDWD